MDPLSQETYVGAGFSRTDQVRLKADPTYAVDMNVEEGRVLETERRVERRKTGRALLESRRSRDARPLFNWCDRYER